MVKFRNENTEYKRGYADGLVNAIEHGHWDDNYSAIYAGKKGWCCSLCDGSVDREWDYCPHCGAKMDEEVEHEDPRDLYGWQI